MTIRVHPPRGVPTRAAFVIALSSAWLNQKYFSGRVTPRSSSSAEQPLGAPLYPTDLTSNDGPRMRAPTWVLWSFESFAIASTISMYLASLLFISRCSTRRNCRKKNRSTRTNHSTRREIRNTTAHHQSRLPNWSTAHHQSRPPDWSTDRSENESELRPEPGPVGSWRFGLGLRSQ